MCQDIPQVIQRAKAAGVAYMQTICTELKQIPDLIKIVDEQDGVFASVGVHPCNIKSTEQIPSVDELVDITKHKKIIGLGETGLDYYHSQDYKKEQRDAFLNHIQVSQITDIPLIVHTRDADDDTAQYLAMEYKNLPFRGLIHCFGSDIGFARKVLDVGFYISISGIVTFKNAEILRDVVKYVPIDRLLIETDAPYLAPVPMRGKKNEPSFVTFVASRIAEIKALSISQITLQTTDNFFKLFDKALR
jgi:TatD DNase family protein